MFNSHDDKTVMTKRLLKLYHLVYTSALGTGSGRFWQLRHGGKAEDHDGNRPHKFTLYNRP